MIILQSNFIDRIFEQAVRQPGATAIRHRGFEIKYGQLECLTGSLLATLLARGARPAQTIAIRLDDEPTHLLVLLAGLRGGIPIYSMPNGDSIHADDTGIRKLGIRQIVVGPEGCETPPLASICIAPVHTWTQVEPRDATTWRDDSTIWMYSTSSGSTGRPKLVGLNHRHLEARMLSNNESIGLSSADRVAMMSTLDFPTPKQRYLEALGAGATVVLLDRARIVDSIVEAGITVLYGTPMHADRLCAGLEGPSQDRFASIRAFCLSTAIVPDGLRKRVAEKVTPNIRIRYGASETSFICTTQPEKAFVPRAVGLPQPGVALKIVGPDGVELDRGGLGVICVRTPGMITGYIDDPINDARYFRDGWFVTGDLGMLLEDGSLAHHGRADNMMIFNGINVSPIEIEECALSYPAVADVAAFSIKSETSQDIPTCAVEFRKGSQASIDDLRSYLREKLGTRCPRIVVALDRIPRSPNGKISRANLAEAVSDRLKRPIS